jgi:Protein kinase domain
VSASIASSLRGGRFRVLGVLGEGAQGRTYDGVDAREGRPVAIKRFDVRGATAWKDVELAEREARVLQSLSHSKLPQCIDRFEEDGALYLVMDKIEGESLAAVRKREGALGELEVERLLRDAADVLAYLHGRSSPVIHRDLKPGNVIRRPDGSFAFVDFGAVRDKLRPDGGSTVVGTFGFMAPEQFQGRALPASDVYAIGATAVAMLAGREPEELPHKGLALDVRAALAGRASDRMVAVLEKMLEPDPDRRAGSIAPLLKMLEGRSSARRRTRGEAAPWEAEWREEFGREMQKWSTRHQRKHARREARREAHRARREARRRERGARVVPWPFSMPLALMFVVSIVLVSLATQLVVPLVLLALSVLFGRPMREAAEAVREAGRSAVEGLHRSRKWVRGEMLEPTNPPAHDAADERAPPRRVDAAARPGARARAEGEPQAASDDDEVPLSEDGSWGEADRRARR